MDIVKILTPENVEVEYRRAKVASRMLASFIDTMIIIVLCLTPTFIMLFRFFYVKSELNSVQIAILALFNFLIIFGYYVFLEVKLHGQTFGKKITNLKVIRKNGQPLEWKHSFIRNIIRVIIDNYFVGVLMMFLKKDSLRLGDLMASTIVVEKPKKEKLFVPKEISDELKEILNKDDVDFLNLFKNQNWFIGEKKEEIKEKTINYFKSKNFDENLIQKIIEELK